MKKRFLRKIKIDTEKPLPENVVQVVNISKSYKVSLNDDGEPVYIKFLNVVVEEDMEK